MTRTIILIALLSNVYQNLIVKSTPITFIPSSNPSHVLNSFENNSCDDTLNGISLNFKGVGLRHLDVAFASSSDVSCLNLEDNEIDHLSTDAFASLPNLVYLNLARNKLPLPSLSRLEGQEQLRTLILDGNAPATSEESTDILQFENTFPRLSQLHLCSIGLRDLKSLDFAPSLTHLYLSSNDLSNSKLLFFENTPATLQFLDLTDSKIQGLNAPRMLASLQELRLNGNRLRKLCKSCRMNSEALVIGEATELRRLGLARNQLQDVEPDAFDDAPALEELDLSDNQLSTVSKGTFESLMSLKNLSIAKNQLLDMPDLCGVELLQYLSLAGNKIEALGDEAFCLIETLKEIDLSGNKIRIVGKNTFAKQKSLEILDLSNNEVKSFPGTWLMPLKNLKVLSVNGNRLRSLNDLALENAVDLKKLERVHLQDNAIRKFYTSSLFAVFKIIPNVTIQFVDPTRPLKSLKNISSDEEVCKCNCDENNEV